MSEEEIAAIVRVAVADEREACAKLVLDRGSLRVKQRVIPGEKPRPDVLVYRAIDPKITAAAIRART